MPSTFSLVFPPAPTFTEANLPSLAGKVIIITGSASGVGFELAKMLYGAGGTVYVAARSEARCAGAIEKIQSQVQFGRGKVVGRLEKMVIDLSDLRTIKPAADSFLGREERLDVLVHNAAVMEPPVGSKDPLGHDLEVSTNCLGPYLLTQLLEPILTRTATTVPPFSVRIVWVLTMLQSGGTPPDGMLFDKTGTPQILRGMNNYFQTKAGGSWLSAHFAERLGDKGILSVSLHPGLMKTELQRHWPRPMRALMGVAMKGPEYGAYTELYAGFSPDLKAEDNGGFFTAWGRKSELPENLISALKSKTDGGSGAAAKFMEYCDRETKGFK